MRTYTAKLFIISAPSGTGKTSLINALLKNKNSKTEALRLSISYTTREPRVGEQNGTDYHFIDKKEFLLKQKTNDFLENALVFGNHYGTSKQWVLDQLIKGSNVLVEIDVQGAIQLMNNKAIKPYICSIFIHPPSLEELKNRLTTRGTDNLETIKKRISEANQEIQQSPLFDEQITNFDFKKTLEQLQDLINKKNKPNIIG